MKVKHVIEQILIKLIKSETKTKKGIFIPPDDMVEITQRGIVVAVGNNNDKIKVNDKVLYNKYAGTPVKFKEGEHLILKMSDILCIIG